MTIRLTARQPLNKVFTMHMRLDLLFLSRSSSDQILLASPYVIPFSASLQLSLDVSSLTQIKIQTLNNSVDGTFEVDFQHALLIYIYIYVGKNTQG